MTVQQIKDKLKANGVTNLIDVGYHKVTAENIMTDYVYSTMFKRMLQENLGSLGTSVDTAINELIIDINTVEHEG